MMIQQSYGFGRCNSLMMSGCNPFMNANPFMMGCCNPFMSCNPFMMGGYNTRMNFLFSIAAATAAMQNTCQPTISMNPCSVFNPYITMNYSNPYTMSGIGSFNYQPQVFTYTPSLISPFYVTPSVTNITAITNPASTQNTQTQNENTSADNDEPSSQGMTLKGKGKGTKYGPEFLKKVKQIAKNLNCNYRDLLAIMNSESGIDSTTVGRNGASGLICFMPEFFDVNKIRKMSPMEQLDEVEKTIKAAKRSAGFADNAKLSKGDLYALVFLPARAGNEVLCKKGERGKDGRLLSYYESNSALDYNNDGKITKEEMSTRIDKKYVSDYTFLA